MNTLQNLLLFGNVCLAVPARGYKSLTILVIRAVCTYPIICYSIKMFNRYLYPSVLLPHQSPRKRPPPRRKKSTESEKMYVQVSKFTLLFIGIYHRSVYIYLLLKIYDIYFFAMLKLKIEEFCRKQIFPLAI